MNSLGVRARRAAGVAMLAASALILIGATSASAEMSVRFEAAAIVATGISPGGEVSWAWALREPTGFYQRVEARQESVVDADGDGVVRLALGSEIPRKALFAVVDGATGEWVMAAPPRGVKREAGLAQEALEADVTGQRNRLALRASSLLVLVVRPGGGAWSGQIFEGGGKDADGRQDGTLLASLDSLQPLSASPSAPLDAVETSDRILAIDVDRLQGYSLVVDEEGPQTGTKEATR